MSLSASLNNALSGLTATSRRAEVVSSNVANALTGGYGRREVEVASRSLGGFGAGVQVVGVTRQVNTAILGDRRLADAEAGNTGARADFLSRIEAQIGTPGDGRSLSDRISTFETALISATSRPDSQARLQAVLDTADALASHLGTLSDEVQTARAEADNSIASQVAELNNALAGIDKLNTVILAERSSGRDANALMDQRQRLVDRVAEFVPVREVARDHDQIALFTTGGAVLLDGLPAVIGFSPVGVVTADMTLASGDLSGLTINGMAVHSGDDGVLGGGSLGAMFAIRDDLAPAAQEGFDALARDLMARFSDPAVDQTLPPGAPGLFTDRGGAFDPLAEVGLAGRLTINATVDPAQGGQLWRLRDGLGAAMQGNVGDTSLLAAMTDAMQSARVPASGPFIGAARSAAGLAADVLSNISGQRQQADLRLSYATTRQAAMTELQLADGVDTDAEMQDLLVIEQAYAANARVIQTIDSLIQTLIGL